MNRKRITSMFLASAVIGSMFCTMSVSAEESVTVTGVFGEEEIDITFEEVPERVVSLAGFATEMLLALGLEEKIVGYAWQDNDVLPQYQEAFMDGIVWGMRFPKVIVAACVGGGLSLVGIMMQAMTKNSLADPYILGISSGASTGATSVILLGSIPLIGASSVQMGAFSLLFFYLSIYSIFFY